MTSIDNSIAIAGGTANTPEGDTEVHLVFNDDYLKCAVKLPNCEH